ncbi:fibronectin type III domain-containing protein [Butyrivibrio sp. WCE2006]|uniref:fibronectin type III domain-containing protein n=1 Tax=Butyrivibrio sp. WCE2006 TaxID=1410611 RepID=UPI0005D200C3|nr:fibronectin type III domain-containing protein [Butyrivibrio sp. WCE2006]
MRYFKKLYCFILSLCLLLTSVANMDVRAEEMPQGGGFSGFVTVDGTKLMDGDRELRFVSLNYPQATSDTPWEHENAMKTFRAMGGNVTRTYTIPVFNGENSARAYVTGVDEAGNLTFNEDALNSLDDVLAKANQYGIRVVIPFVDHWHWIGGIDGYVWLAGESDGNAPSQSGFQDWAWKFYSSERCMELFKQMITHLLNRTNTVTGVQYKDDPAILCWETGNEMGNRSQVERDDELTAWTNQVVEHVKSIDTNHLVLDGRMSMSPRSLGEENLADILGAHYYEGNYAQRCEEDTRAAHAAGKPFILGEFGAKVTAGPCIDVFQKGVENDTNGIMMWSLRAHKDGFGYYFHNEDGYWASYHWPGFESGNYYGETEIIRSIYAYAQIVNGEASNYEEAAAIPIPAPETDEAPLLYSENGTPHDNSFAGGSVGDIKWRGVVGGAWYEIQRAEGSVTDQDSELFETIAGADDYVYDSGRNWEDKSHDCIAGYHDMTAVDGQTYSYRIRACNESGVGPWSNIVVVENVKHVVKDELDLIAVSSNDQNPTEIRRTYSSDHSANIEHSGSTIVNKSAEEGYIEYSSIIPVEEVKVQAVSEAAEGAEPKLMVSSDGISYEEIGLIHETGSTLYSASSITASKACYYSRIYLKGNSSCKLDSIEITYKNGGDSYNDNSESGKVRTNAMIQDATFGENAEPYYVSKDTGLVVGEAEGIRGLTTADPGKGSIVYKTGDDINAFRVSTAGLNGKRVIVEYSFDGVTFNPAKELTVAAGETVENIVYGDLNVSQAVRVIRVTVPENSAGEAFVRLVEISSGKKMIPLADASPANIIEDGEYYVGSNDSLNAVYRINGCEGEITFSKDLGEIDYTAFDSIYLWVKPDNSSNELRVRLLDAENHVWESDAVLLSGGAEMKKLFLTKDGDFNWSDVREAQFVVKSSSAAGNGEGHISLDAGQVYTGNYGIALGYSFGEEEKVIYIDSVYANSSVKVDDFEGYSGSNTLLNQAYSRNTNGGKFNLSLDSVNKYEGAYGLKIDYDYDGKGYAGATKNMDMLNLGGYDGFTMYLDSDGSGNEIKVQMETDTSTYAYTGYMTGKGPMLLYMPFAKIIQPDWATSGTPQPINSSQNLKSVSIYTNQTGTVTSGTLYVDDLKGANFVEDLTEKAGVTIDEPSGLVTEFPYTISGTADYVEYVTVSVGEKKYNVPVNGEGVWSFELTADAGIVNGDDIKVKAGVYYPDGEAIAESSEYAIRLEVEDNDGPEEEHYDNVIWSWDFAEMGTEGWSFEGFSPWTENGRLVAWSQDGYDAVFSYTITDVPNGVYTLSNDIKVKSNMNSAVMALSSGESEIKSTPIDTADTVVEDHLLGEKLTVDNNSITVKYYVNAPVDANGVTFAVGDIKLYLVKALENDDPEDDEVHDGDEKDDSGEGTGTEGEIPDDSGEGTGTEGDTPDDFGGDTGAGDETPDDFGGDTGAGDDTPDDFGGDTGAGDETPDDFGEETGDWDETPDDFGEGTVAGDEISGDSGEGEGTESGAVNNHETVSTDNNTGLDLGEAAYDGSTAINEVIDSKQKKTSISELTAKKKAITVSWKKQSKGIKGYEIQYSTNKKFEENVKTVKIGKAKTTKKTIKKLKSGKKYYLRIRTYKEKDGGIVYSNWSKKKSIKVK